MQIIPITSDDHDIELTTSIAERELTFAFKFNTRAKVWSFDLYDTGTGDLLVKNVQVLLGVDLLEDVPSIPGHLAAVDMQAQRQYGGSLEDAAVVVSLDAGEEDLGTRVKLVYFTLDEVL